MDIKTLSTDEAKAAVTAMESKDELRQAATDLGIPFSGNTGEGTLRKKVMDHLEVVTEEDPILAALGGTEEDEIPVQEPVKQPKAKGPPTLGELALMDASKEKDPVVRRKIVRARALRLSRVIVTNLDPSDAQLEGNIYTAMNQYTGKVSKYIPFGDDSGVGYHIPEILLNIIRAQKFALRKEIKGGQFGVKKYKTTMVPKFSIQILDNLKPEELKAMAVRQSANNSIE